MCETLFFFSEQQHFISEKRAHIFNLEVPKILEERRQIKFAIAVTFAYSLTLFLIDLFKRKLHNESKYNYRMALKICISRKKSLTRKRIGSKE